MHRFRIALLVAAIGFVVAWLGSRGLHLRSLHASADQLRASAHELAPLREAHAKLQAARPSETDLAAWREERAAIARLRHEIEAVRRSAEAREPSSAPAPAVGTATLLEARLTAGQWRNACQATPAATVETLLWAAAGGDVERLAETLTLGPETRARAEALFGSLPPDSRREHGTPERLMALMTASDVPLGQAQVVAEVPNSQGTVLVTELEDTSGHSRVVALALRTDGHAWRVELPPAAVDRYAAMLRNRNAAVRMGAVRVR